MDLSQYWIAIFGVSAILLVNQHSPKLRRWGPIMGMLSQPAWFYATWKAEQYGIFILSFIYAYSWGMGIYNCWFRKPLSVELS
ncbi:MAG TPA: hypothetical protein VIG24_16290 [Acidimicrobiia bacterium]